MKILVHACCAPCCIFPLEQLRNQFDQIELLFYNPNIHPYTEYRARLDCLKQLSATEKILLHVPEEYDLKPFFRKVAFNESTRCTSCYDLRLSYSARFAKENGFDAVTTTLLYSKYQNHGLLTALSKKYAVENGIVFHYQDYREGWQYGIDESVARKMYRQKYCGCLYSEQERFDNRWKKRQLKLKKNNLQISGKENG